MSCTYVLVVALLVAPLTGCAVGRDSTYFKADAGTGELAPVDAAPREPDATPRSTHADGGAWAEEQPDSAVSPWLSDSDGSAFSADTDVDAGVHERGQVPGIIAVGYGGLRIISRDDGATWSSRKAVVDGENVNNANLLRGIAWGNGMWVATGWKVFRSTNGVDWEDDASAEAALEALGCGLMESVAFGNGTFVGVCGEKAYLSQDGHSWTGSTLIGATGGQTYVTFGNGKFAASGDNNTASFTSTDGLTWTPLPGVSRVRFCNDALVSYSECFGRWLESGTWLRTEWAGRVLRSTNGDTFTETYSDGEGNALYSSDAFAEGFVDP